MAAVAPGVAPVVVSSPLVGYPGRAAADDHSVMTGVVRVHVSDPAVVKAGVLDADHLSFAAEAFHVQIIDVRHRFRPDVVAFRHSDLVFLDEADFRKIGQLRCLPGRYGSYDARFEIAGRQFVFADPHRFQFLSDDFPVLGFYGADQDLERLLFSFRRHRIREGHLVFRQIRSEVREFKARLEVT